jgi:hypothetical protein
MSSANFAKAIQERNSPLRTWFEINKFVPTRDLRTGTISQVPLPLTNSQLQRTVVVPYQPQTTPTSNTLVAGANGAFTDYYIQTYDALLYDFYLQVTLTETGGANSVTPVSAPLLVSYIQILGENSGVELQRLFGQSMWADLGLYTNEDIQTISSKINMGTNFQPLAAIAASGTATYTILPITNFFPYVKLYTQPLNSYITIRVWWNGNSVFSGSGTLALSSSTLFAKYLDLPDKDKEQMRAYYMNNRIGFPVFTTINYNTSQTFTASNTYTLPMQSFNGEQAYMQIFFMSTITGSGWQTITYPGDTSTWSYLDSSNNSILSPQPLRGDIMRYEEIRGKFAGTFYVNVGAIPIMFDPAISYALLQGIQSGYFLGTAKEQLSFVLPSTFTTGTYYLYIYLRTRQHIHLSKGRFEMQLP